MTSNPDTSESEYVFGAFRLDAAKHVLWRGAELVALQPKAVELLAALVGQAGDVVSKDELLARVWPETFVEEANLSVNVSALRRALGTQPDGRPWIVTVARRGYRFAGVLAAAPPPPQAPRPALAVLPFRTLGAGDEGETLGLALADAVIARLSGRSTFLVRPTSAMLSYVGRSLDPQTVARELRVELLIEGLVQRDGERLRVTVQGVAPQRAGAAWAAELQLTFTGIFDLQDAVAELAAGALARATETTPAAPPSRRPTLDGQAYQAYLRGRHFWSRFGGADLQRAYECFEQATQLDPAYAHPHAGLAQVQLVLGFSGIVEPRYAWPLAEKSAVAALARDPQLADAHVALAYVALFERWDWPAAEAALETARRCEPESPAAHTWSALLHLLRGRLEAALVELRLAEDRDPLAAPLLPLFGLHAALSRDFAAEGDLQRRALEVAPHQFVGHWGLGLAEEHLGRAAEAIAHHRRALELSEGSPFLKGVLARSLALGGQKDEARSLLAQLEDEPLASATAYQRATAQLALGQRKAALAMLERAALARNPWLVLLGVDPMLEGLRGVPAFEALRERVCPGVGVRTIGPPAAKATRRSPRPKAGTRARRPRT